MTWDGQTKIKLLIEWIFDISAKQNPDVESVAKMLEIVSLLDEQYPPVS